jgi:cysteine desulfurase
MLRVYLDHNATAPLASELKSFVTASLEHWGNPSSIHYQSRGPKALVREARTAVAQTLGAHPLEIVFTSGGSEANNMAIKGFLGPKPAGERNHILISAVEHPSVTETALSLQEMGYVVERIPVDREGRLDLKIFESLLRPSTALVSCMFANNETGHLFPIARMARIAQERGVAFHCDGVQGLGKVPLDVKNLGVDMMSFSGHKFYALKGCGVLFIRRGLQVRPLIHGGSQERFRRAGTENTLAIATLGRMCQRATEISGQGERLAILRDHLEEQILKNIEGVQIAGRFERRLPNTTSMTIADVDGEALLMALDVRGFSVSTGAACSSGSPEPSPVLLAMGLSRSEAQSSLRISLGWENTAEEITRFVEALTVVVQHLRSLHERAVSAI